MDGVLRRQEPGQPAGDDRGLRPRESGIGAASDVVLQILLG